MNKQNMKCGKRILALVLTLIMVLSLVPSTVFAESTSTVETDLAGKSAIVGEYLVFQVETMANENAGAAVLGHLTFNEGDWSVVESLQYMETNGESAGQWFDLPANVPFGPPSTGFPLTDHAKSTFRVKFNAPGKYPFTISIKSADGATEYCVANEEIEVKNPVAAQVYTDINGQTAVVGQYLEFKVTTMANDDANAAVLGHLDFNGGDWSVVESLQYKETSEPNAGQWFDLPAGVPFGPAGTGFPLTDNATSEFRVKFKTAGAYPFTISMKSVDGATEYCSATESVNVRDCVASQLSVNIPDTIVIGQEVQFGVATVANDDLNKKVLGHLEFNGGDWSGVEFLKYQETQEPYAGQWFELPANVPFGPVGGFPMKDAESKFSVKFNVAGDYTFRIAMKTANAAANELCYIEKTIHVTDQVSVTTKVNDSAMGTATAESRQVTVGTATSVQVKANKGYAISEIYVDGEAYDFEQYSTSVNVEIAPVLDTQVEVKFVRLYQIQVNYNENGDVTVNGIAPSAEGSIALAETEIDGEKKITVVATPGKAGFSVESFVIEDYTGELPQLPQEAGEAYEVVLEPNDYVIQIVFADITPAVITVTDEPETEWNSEKSFSFTVEDSAEGACEAYISESDVLDTATAEKLIADENGIYTYVVAEDISSKDYYIHAVDANSVKSWYKVEVKQIDTQKPVIDNTIVVTKKGNADYTLTISDDGGSEIAGVWYTTDANGVEDLHEITANEGVYTFSGKLADLYYIVVKDNAGNTLVEEVADPSIQIVSITASENWIADEMPVGIAVDSASAAVQVYWSTAEYVDAASVQGTSVTVGEGGNYVFYAPANGTYYIYAIDAITMHMDIGSVTIETIDNTDPVVDTDTIAKNPNLEWYNQSVTISGQVSDWQENGITTGSGVVKVVYGTEAGYDKANKAAVLNAETGEYSFVEDIEEDTSNDFTYYVWAVDGVGKVSEPATIEIKFDKVEPTGVVSLNKHTTTWETLFNILTFGIFRNANTDVIISVVPFDKHSGIVDANVQYYVADILADSCDGLTEGDLIALYDAGEFAEYPADGVKIENEYRGAVYFRIEDNAGNATYLNSDGIIRDVTPPEVTISAQKFNAETNAFEDWDEWTGAGEEGEKNDTFNDRSFTKLHSNTEVVLTVTFEDLNPDYHSDIQSVGYYKSKSIMDVNALKALDAAKWTACENGTAISFKDNERLVLYVRAEDHAGNVTYISSNGIVVDNKTPSGDEFDETPNIIIIPEDVPETGFYTTNPVVSVTVYDPQYLLGNSADSEHPGDFSGLKEVTYKVYTTDEGAEIEASGVLYSNVPVEDIEEEETEDVAENVVLKDNAAFDDEETGLICKWAGQIEISAETFNSNNVIVEITAIDNAGNVRTSATKLGDIQIDVTAPVIRVEYSEETEYSSNTRTATIYVQERNFDPFKLETSKELTGSMVNTIIATHGSEVAVGPWTLEEVAEEDKQPNGDHITHMITVVFEKDDHYQISALETKDAAGNPAEYAAGQVFTIDKTLPVVTVSYNNNSAQNGKYFDAYRTATVTVVEHNFPLTENGEVDKGVANAWFEINAKRNGKAPDISWSIDKNTADTYIAKIVYSADGDYTFAAEVTDLASNTCKDTSVHYGYSVAAKDFVIDTKKPVITHSGVEHGNAYGHDAEVIPSIRIDDINLQEHDVSLVGVQMGKTIDLTAEVKELLKGGQTTITGVFDLFETKQDLDGIYTLKVTAKDMAGNADALEVVFTVNRFGSVYVYSDELVALIKDGGQFVPSVDTDLVITEYNADKLLENSLQILITRDGETVEVDYTSTPTINDQVTVGESGWYQYVYTIKASNFAQDGVYKMSLSSKYATVDAPENESTSVPENSKDQKGEGILDTMTFTVDNTAPEIRNVINLDKAIADKDKIVDGKLNVQYTIVDVGGLKSIEVFVNGKVVQTISEEELAESAYNYTGSFDLDEQTGTVAHKVQIVVTDLAGNVTDTNSEEFLKAHSKDNKESTYVFHNEVTVSRNIFVRFYANKPLFYGSIGGVIAIAAAICILIAALKKKQGAGK